MIRQFLRSSLIGFVIFQCAAGEAGRSFSQCATQMISFVGCVNKLDKFVPMELNPDYDKKSAECFESAKCPTPKYNEDVEADLTPEEKKIWKIGRSWWDSLSTKSRRCIFDAWVGDKEDHLDTCFKIVTGSNSTAPLWSNSRKPSLDEKSKDDFYATIKKRTKVSYLLQETCAAEKRQSVRRCLAQDRTTMPVIPDREKCLKQTDAAAPDCITTFSDIQSLTCRCIGEKQRQLKAKLTKTVLSWADGKDDDKHLERMKACADYSLPTFIKEHPDKGVQVDNAFSKEMGHLVAAYIFAEQQNYHERFCHRTVAA